LILAKLQENIQAARAVLDPLECITIPSHPASPLIHIYIRTPSPALLDPSAGVAPTWDIESEERLLQSVVEEVMTQGVMITKAKRLRGQEKFEARPSIQLALTSALTKKETVKAVGVVKAALQKFLGKTSIR